MITRQERLPPFYDVLLLSCETIAVVQNRQMLIAHEQKVPEPNAVPTFESLLCGHFSGSIFKTMKAAMETNVRSPSNRIAGKYPRSVQQPKGAYTEGTNKVQVALLEERRSYQMAVFLIARLEHFLVFGIVQSCDGTYGCQQSWRGPSDAFQVFVLTRNTVKERVQSSQIAMYQIFGNAGRYQTLRDHVVSV